MYKDIISYQLAANVTEQELLTVADRILNEWMGNQPGFIRWEIHKDSEDGYTDIVYWESKEAAQKAEKEMKNIPDASEWFDCYLEGSIKSEHLNQIAVFRSD